MKRRNLILALPGAAAVLLAAGYSALFLQRWKRSKRRKVFLGMADAIEEGEVMLVEVNGEELALVKAGGKIIALSTTCTHLGCRVVFRKAEKIFFCPCHRGKFDLTGKVLEGPPPLPLRRKHVKVEEGVVFMIEEAG